MSKERKAAIAQIHDALADELCTQLEPLEVTADDGTVTKVRASASVLNVARQFLKDNGIDALADEGTGKLAGLASKVSDYVKQAQDEELAN